MARYKKYMDHTPRWRSKAAAEGITRQRWDAWFNLSEKTRKTTPIREYAKGRSVRDIALEPLRATVRTRMNSLEGANAETVDEGVRMMTKTELSWTATASVSDIRDAARSARGERPVRRTTGGPVDERSPWWYH